MRAGLSLRRRLLVLSAGGMIRSSGQLLAGHGVTQAGIFLAGIIVARAEDPAAFGLYSAALALAAVIVGGVAAGLPILMIRRAAQSDVDRATLRRAVRLQTWLSLVAAAATTLVGGLLLGGRSGALASGAAAIFFGVNHLVTLGQSVLSGLGRYGRAAATDVVAGALFPLFTAVAVGLETGIVGALVAVAAACGISGFVAWTSLPDLVFGTNPAPLRARDGLSFGLLGLAKAGYGRLDTVALGAIAGSAPAGHYAAAYRLLGPFQLLGRAVSTVYFSRMSQLADDPARWRDLRRRTTTVFVATTVAGAAALALLAPWLIRLFYGPQYEASVGPAQVLLLSVLPWSLYWLQLSELASIRRERLVTVALTVGLVTNGLVVAAVSRRHGALGAAWAWLASESAMLLVLTIVRRKVTSDVRPHLAGEAGGPHAGSPLAGAP